MSPFLYLVFYKFALRSEEIVSFTENLHSISYQKGELWQLHQFGKIILSPWA